MSPGDALLFFIAAAYVTIILNMVLLFGLRAFPRPLPSSNTTPQPCSLRLDSSERADDSETQTSSPPPQVNDKSCEDGLAARNPVGSSGTDSNEPDGLGPRAKFSLATIMLIFIALLLFVQVACIQRWKQCSPVRPARWDVYAGVMWIVFVFELGVSSLALERWLMLLCDLWGDAGRKALPVRESFLLMVVVIAIFGPFVMFWTCVNPAARKRYRDWNQSRVNKDDFATPLEARGLLTSDDPEAELDQIGGGERVSKGVRVKAVSEVPKWNFQTCTGLSRN